MSRDSTEIELQGGSLDVLKSSEPNGILNQQWRPLLLAMTHLLSCLLLISYWIPAGRAVWQEWDTRVFYLLNGTLAGPGLWEQLWAWANTRYCDAFGGLVILMFLLYPIAGFRRDQLQSVAFLCCAMMLTMLALRTGFHYFCDWIDLQVIGPSLVLSPVVRLSELFPSIPLKDASTSSFPGDHATVLFAWAGFVLMGSRGWKSWLAAGIPLVLVLPRLFSGAHWLSDQLVGGMFVAIPALGWTYGSPLVALLARQLAWVSAPILTRVSGWPWLRNQQFFVNTTKTPALVADSGNTAG